MKVYVCYCDYDSDEGCSPPEAVFLNEAEALDWCKGNNYHEYAVFEIAE